jgi:hypothetical protein
MQESAGEQLLEVKRCLFNPPSPSYWNLNRYVNVKKAFCYVTAVLFTKTTILTAGYCTPFVLLN